VRVDFAETAEVQALRKTVAEISARFGGAYYARKAEAHEPTTELWDALAQAGFIGVNVPEEHGGGGGGLRELAAVCEETAAQGCPLLLLLVSQAISAEVITRYGSDAQKRRWLPGLAAGTSKVVFAITEPDAGSNTHELATAARRDGDGWMLSGTKHYISGVDEADAVLVVARTGTERGREAQPEREGDGGRAALGERATPDLAPRRKPRLSLFVVPTDAPGFAARPLPVSAQLPERQFTLHLDDVRLGPEALVGEEGQGFTQVFHGLNPERITGAAVCVGVARYALDRAAAYARDRSVWDRPIGTHQGVSHPLAKAKIETELAALMTRRAAWEHDTGRPAGEAANMAKYAAAEAALAAVDAAIQTHGGNGLSTEYGLVPLWGIARLLRIAPVNREMVLNYVAQHSLGLPRSY
jgi:alkylation response protein AidB-like acyl-CoA dehydrogenase